VSGRILFYFDGILKQLSSIKCDFVEGFSLFKPAPVIASAAKQSMSQLAALWIASLRSQ
jgi:hypothetical protein